MADNNLNHLLPQFAVNSEIILSEIILNAGNHYNE